MANARVVDLNADFVGLGWRNLDVLNGKVLASLPSNGRLSWLSALPNPRPLSQTLHCLL
jgi:hypothetical protein